METKWPESCDGSYFIEGYTVKDFLKSPCHNRYSPVISLLLVVSVICIVFRTFSSTLSSIYLMFPKIFEGVYDFLTLPVRLWVSSYGRVFSDLCCDMKIETDWRFETSLSYTYHSIPTFTEPIPNFLTVLYFG